MELMEVIAKRRSVRKYLEKPVAWDDIGTILDAGRLAPSAGNLQNWKFIVVTDEAKRKAIADACLQQRWMETAPVHIVVCSEPRKAIQFYGIRGDRLYSIQNCAAATQNMLLAATNIGLGSCWIGAFDEGMLKSAASIADEARPQSVITLGYSAEEPKEPMHYTIENVTFLQRWGSRIGDMDAVMGHYGNKLHRHIENAGKAASKETATVHKKIKDRIEKFIDNRRMAKHKKEHEAAGVRYDETEHAKLHEMEEQYEDVVEKTRREEAELARKKKQKEEEKKRKYDRSFDQTTIGR